MTRASDHYNAPMSGLEDGRRLHAEATLRNRDAILEALSTALPHEGLVLEIASGTGEHAIYFAPRLAPLTWQPSDPNAEMRASIATWRETAPSPGLRPPLALDVTDPAWPLERADALVAINLLHIAPWPVCPALMAGAARLLPPGGPLVLYGAYKVGGRHTAPSNAAFDDGLRARNPDWGVRDVEAVDAAARAHGLEPAEHRSMPNNNFFLVYRRTGAPKNSEPLEP